MGESRWRVHGSTLLADSAGASGRMRSNTRHYPRTPRTPPSLFFLFSFFLSLPFSRHCTLKTINARTCARCHSAHFSPLPDIDALPPADCTGRPPLGSPLSALQSLVFHSHSLVSALSRPFPLLSLPSYLITLTATSAPLTPLLPIILCPSSALSPSCPSSAKR